jgi:hypothetical protein
MVMMPVMLGRIDPRRRGTDSSKSHRGSKWDPRLALLDFCQVVVVWTARIVHLIAGNVKTLNRGMSSQVREVKRLRHSFEAW